MGSPTADIRLNIAANSAAAQYDMLAARMKRMTASMAKGTDDVRKSSKAAGSEFGKWAGGVGKALGTVGAMALAFKGVQTVVQGITYEFQKMIDLSNNKRERQIPYQQRLRTMLFQSIPADVQDKEAVLAEIDKKIKGSSVRDKTALAAIIQKTISTMGTTPIQDRVDFGLAIGEARRDLIGGDQQQSLEAFAGVAGAAHMRLADQGSTPNAQLGLMNKTITASAVSDMNSFSQNLAPTINKLVNNFGLNQIEAAAMVSGFSTALDDLSGELTGTAAINSMQVFREAQQRFGIKPAAGEGFFQQQKFMRGTDKKAVGARHWMLGQFENGIPDLTEEERQNMSDAMLNKAFTPKVPGRAKTKFTQMQMVQPLGTADYEGSLNKLMTDVLPQLGAISKNGKIDMRATYKNLAQIELENQKLSYRSPMFSTANQEQMTSEALESVLQREGNTVVGQIATPGSDFNKLVDSLGRDWIQGKLDRREALLFSGESTEDSLKRQYGILKREQRRYLKNHTNEVNAYNDLGFFKPAPSHFLKYQGIIGEGNRLTKKKMTDLGFKDETASTAMDIELMLNRIAEGIEALHAQGEKPKEVKIRQSGQQPAKPAAAEIGK